MPVLQLGLPDRSSSTAIRRSCSRSAGWTPPASSSRSSAASARAGAAARRGRAMTRLDAAQSARRAGIHCWHAYGAAIATSLTTHHDQPDRRPAHPRHARRARRAPPRDPARRRPGRALSAAAARSTARSQPTVAEWALDVALPAEQKGTHMSRFVAWLDALDAPLDAAALRARARRACWRCSTPTTAASRPLPVLPAQARAGVGRREPARVPGPLDRRDARRREARVWSRSSCR